MAADRMEPAAIKVPDRVPPCTILRKIDDSGQVHWLPTHRRFRAQPSHPATAAGQRPLHPTPPGPQDRYCVVRGRRVPAM